VNRLAEWTEPGAARTRAETLCWILALAAGLGLRLAAAAERSATATLTGMVDSQIYLQLAAHLRSSGWMPPEGFYMSPAYPYGLALLGTKVGAVLPVLILQSLYGVVALAALGLVSRRFGGALAGIVTVFLGAFAAPVAIYDVSLLSDGPSFAFMAVALALWTLRPESQRSALLGGILAALAYALRANFLLPVLGVALLRVRGPWRRTAAIVGPLVVVLFVLAIVNQRVEGHFTPRSFNAGQNLYIGNNPDADGGYTTLNEIHPGDMMGRAAAESARGRRLDAAEVEQFWNQHARSFLARNPGEAVTLALRKLVLFLHPYELPQMEALALVRRESVAIRMMFVGLGLVLVLAIVGATALRRHEHRAFAPFWIALAAAAFTCVVFFVNGRLRLPMWHTLLPLAGIGATALIARRERSLWVASAVGIVLLALLAFYPTHGPYRNALSAARYAVLETLAGNRDAGSEWMVVEQEIEAAPAGIWSRPEVASTFAQHEQSRALLKTERAAAWFVLSDLQRAYRDMVAAADALPKNSRAQEGLIQICTQLLDSGMGDREVAAARQRAAARLQALQRPPRTP